MSQRTDQVKNDHVAFLQQKKAEILAKKQKERDAGSGPPPAQPKVTKVEAKGDPPKVNLMFANDGSFMERFKAMQQQKQLTTKTKEEEECPGPPPPLSRELQRQPPPPPPPPQIKPSHTLPGVASIFQEEEEVEGYLPTEYDLAKELAARVAEDGLHVEEKARKTHLGDSRYKFLTDPSSPVALYYQSELRAGQKRKREEVDGKGGEEGASSSINTSSSGAYGSQQSTPSGSNSTVVDPKAEFEKVKALFAAKAAAVKGGGPVSTPAPVVTEEELKKQKAIQEQKMMNELYRKVIEEQAYMAAQRVAAKEDKPRYEYDSDEDTEGGTWEHKKRKKEMQKTEEWAGDLTEKGRGKHHLSDFLPPEELEKFMENVKAVQEGRQADISDYAKFKIQADNVGFQLLQKAGWEEGSGLGKKGDGIQQPVNRGKTAFEQAGVGAEKPMEVKKDDDDFELYRKRMMLAYKFRPNPLNNPRRPYYE